MACNPEFDGALENWGPAPFQVLKLGEGAASCDCAEYLKTHEMQGLPSAILWPTGVEV